MILPVHSTPVNINPPFEEENIPERVSGRHYNLISECEACGGTVFGCGAYYSSTSGRCSVCGRYYVKNTDDPEAVQLDNILSILDNFCTVPDLKLWHPDWINNLPLPVAEQLRHSFLFCSDCRSFMVSLKHHILQRTGILTYTADHEAKRRRGPGWIAVIEQTPGSISGLKIFSECTEEFIWIWAKRQYPSIFHKEENYPAGQYLKLGPDLDSFISTWDNLNTEAGDLLLGSDINKSVFVQAVNDSSSASSGQILDKSFSVNSRLTI